MRFPIVRRALLLLALAVPLVATGPAASRSSQPQGWDSDLALPVVADLNPDPHILEINLEARIQDIEILPGKRTAVWSYNGGLPGPLIRLVVGDRLIVHFTNNLPEETTIHWHGLRLPNAMDGAPGVTQPAVAANGGVFTYDFVVPDAGTFWYHPHSNSGAQLSRGLYGPMLVTDPHDPPAFGEDLVLMLSDISLNSEGQINPANEGTYLGDLFGREGNILLVNGKVRPALKVRQGQPQRWRIINAARARFFTLDYGQAPFVKLGGDDGLAAAARRVTAVRIVPGERADVVFIPQDRPGARGVLRWLPTERGPGSTFNRLTEDLMTIETVRERAVRAPRIRSALRTIAPIDTAGARQRDIALTIRQRPDGSMEMGINGVPHDKAPPLVAHVGDTEVWTVRNDTSFAHPFHLHGFFFQVLDPARVPEWKDTAEVPAKTTLRLAVHFDRPGLWMFHCHILDHADAGMMGQIRVLAAGEAPGGGAVAHQGMRGAATTP